jgi:hypothetical protein
LTAARSPQDDRSVRTWLVIALAGLAVAGCGGNDGEASSRAADTTTAKPDSVALARFLLRKDEMPGFVPAGEPGRDSSPAGFGFSPEGEEKLRKNGFITSMYQPVETEGANAGVSSVMLFETEAGARDWMAYETSEKGIHDLVPDTKIDRFGVPGVPGGRGWTGVDVHNNRNGHVYWVQGRCMMLIGNEGKGPFEPPLAAGAKAIYERTNGTCPD